MRISGAWLSFLLFVHSARHMPNPKGNPAMPKPLAPAKKSAAKKSAAKKSAVPAAKKFAVDSIKAQKLPVRRTRKAGV
jgi:hypothetical protein